jgi:hypothetical protein
MAIPRWWRIRLEAVSHGVQLRRQAFPHRFHFVPVPRYGGCLIVPGDAHPVCRLTVGVIKKHHLDLARCAIPEALLQVLAIDPVAEQPLGQTPNLLGGFVRNAFMTPCRGSPGTKVPGLRSICDPLFMVTDLHGELRTRTPSWGIKILIPKEVPFSRFDDAPLLLAKVGRGFTLGELLPLLRRGEGQQRSRFIQDLFRAEP